MILALLVKFARWRLDYMNALVRLSPPRTEAEAKENRIVVMLLESRWRHLYYYQSAERIDEWIAMAVPHQRRRIHHAQDLTGLFALAAAVALVIFLLG